MSLARIVASRAADSSPPFLGKRFDARGHALRCSGSTIVGHLREPASSAFAAAVDRIAEGPARDCWAWLPVPSHHMTIFDLLQHEQRSAEFWPDALSRKLPAAEADRYMLESLRGFALETDPVFRIRVHALEAGEGGLWARVEPASAEENTRLRDLRDRLARHVGLDHRPGHDGYSFHVTLAYAIGWPTAGQAAAMDILIGAADAELKSALPMFEIGPPEVCLFDDMREFRTQFTLR